MQSQLNVNKPGPTWDKHSHLLRSPGVLINALIHACVLPAHTIQRQSAGCGTAAHNPVAWTAALNLFQLKERHVFLLERPLRLAGSGAGEVDSGAPSQDDLLAVRRDLQAAHFGAEIQESCGLQQQGKRSGWRSRRRPREVKGYINSVGQILFYLWTMKDMSCTEQICWRIMMQCQWQMYL